MQSEGVWPHPLMDTEYEILAFQRRKQGALSSGFPSTSPYIELRANLKNEEVIAQMVWLQ